jgi:glycosyltransferase involved in cell wall biosynthesis
MGEAALAGVPVVCTDVGASFRVVTNPETGKRFSAVVAPNDALSLARAQIDVLALLGEWSEFADDEEECTPTLSAIPTKDEIEMIKKRMYEKSEQRRRLGMMGRTNVQTSFSEERYLREHEQMLWVGQRQSRSHQAKLHETKSRAMSSSTTASKIKEW